MRKKSILIGLILLLALLVRIYALDSIPPGLTHDEANHGREALDILDGMLLFYFPLNYGSEPLYSYTVAAAMLLLGKSLFALRIVNVVFGIATIGGTAVWAEKAFDKRVALISAVLLTLSFWPVASSRQALRAGILPFFMMGAVIFFWQLLASSSGVDTDNKGRWKTAVFFGICVAITLHIYLAARVAWTLFPLFLLYLAITNRRKLREMWVLTLGGLGLAGLLAAPMFFYLARYPYALTRLDMLDGPLQQLKAGNLQPIIHNITNALLAFIWPGRGDHFLAYNIPGRPVFDGITAVFFLVGIAVCVWRWKRPSYAFLLLWFVTGIIPSLITGATANTTRNLAALPASFILPAVGFVFSFAWVQQRWSKLALSSFVPITAVWLTFAGGIALRDYFVVWGTAADVRGAYQHTLIEEIAYLETVETNDSVVLSSVYPGPAHDPSIYLVMTGGDPNDSRWVDARFAMLFPSGSEAQMLVPASTPPHRRFAEWLTAVETITLKQDDLDPHFTHFQINLTNAEWWPPTQPIANFDNAVQLIYAEWLSTVWNPGDVAELMTIWHVIDSTRVGPIVPPAFTTDAVLFTHVLNVDGTQLTQQDALNAPSWDWQPGDVIVQIHPIQIPPDTAIGAYPTIVGLYDSGSGERKHVVDEAGQIIDSAASVAPLQVEAP
jgi:4-amino-4-deoxy-L-arabinose transferase-like glycosyltransferase